ncbi:GNAT family N-acetyltransferase [Pseudobutyrivibrio sp. ACV-2]|uniref:GNAT family N-acetyltransferase n=1 Tax=Pseudobutyrivibrio sp. ACV-2 TaxID=1520801 RepID=UPI0011152023|nr:GNAT family N-acetyltransferase [Pseudobutyrivibrio sp. ACV-2]
MKGYGKAALEQVLAYIKTKPFGDSNRVTLTCNMDNTKALALYQNMGFLETGVVDDEEKEFSTIIC